VGGNRKWPASRLELKSDDPNPRSVSLERKGIMKLALRDSGCIAEAKTIVVYAHFRQLGRPRGGGTRSKRGGHVWGLPGKGKTAQTV